MATINGKTSTYWTFKLEVTEGSPNIEDNTSPLTVKAYIGRGTSAGGSYMYGASISCPVNVTGCPQQTITYKNAARVDIAQGAWLHIGTVTFQVPHDSDGSKTVTISASFTNNISPSSGSASGTMTLTTIPRASQPSCITWPEHTQNVGEFGDTISIHMNRKSENFIHDVRYAFGDLTGYIEMNVEKGTTWTIPLSFMNKIPNATSGSGTIYVDTFNDETGELVGTKYCGFTATVPASVKPSVTATLTDTAGIDDIYGSPVVSLSKIKVTTKATLAYSSQIKSTQITIDGATYSANEVTTGFLQNKGASKVSVVVTDQRGRKSAPWEYTMNVQDYTRPQIPMLAVHRTNGDWEENDQGDHVSVTFSAQVSPVGDKNLADYTLRYKKTTEDTWQTIDLSEVDNNFNLFNYAVLFEADVASSYDVEITVTDRHHSAARSTSASTAFSLMDWHNSGTGIAFGKVAEYGNTMDVALAFLLSGGICPIELQEGDDLNADKYKVSGWYRCGMSATAASLLNCPTEKAFVMEVLPNVPTTQRITEYVQDATPRIFLRNYYDYLDTWGEWYELVPRQNRIANVVSLIGLGSGGTYTFPSDGYLVLRAHYSAQSYVNCVLSGSNGKGFRLTATSGDMDDLTGNPTDAIFVRKGMVVSAVATSNTSQNALEFHPLY